MAEHRRIRPEAVPTLTPRATPPAPYRFGDNQHTLLGVSDLVFIDAVGTGFSRLVGDGRPEEVWGVDQDVDAFSRAITRYPYPRRLVGGAALPLR